jgi:hypothetical protein
MRKALFFCAPYVLTVVPLVLSVAYEPRSVSPGQLGDLQFRAVKRSSRVIEAARWLQTSLHPQVL